MSNETQTPRVKQLRVVVEAEDFERAAHFYRDVLGLPESLFVESEGGAMVMILDAGRATLELANPAQKRLIDDVEVGRQVAPHIRLAFEVANTEEVTGELTEGGADLIAAPVETPWRSLNSRLKGEAGLQLTIFQELEPADGADSGVGTTDHRQVVEQFITTLDRRDWDAWRELMAEDVVYEIPQSRERIRGRDRYEQFNRQYPGNWNLEPKMIVADGSGGVAWFDWLMDSEREGDGMAFFEFEGGSIVKVTDFWPEEFEPPPGREHLTERW